MDLSAPGVELITTYPRSFVIVSGMSFSSSLVSGLAGLVEELGMDDAIQTIEDGTDELTLEKQHKDKLGEGRINTLTTFSGQD